MFCVSDTIYIFDTIINKNKPLDTENRGKANVNLSIDSNVLDVIRDEAKQNGTSVNSKVNTILSNYVTFYKKAEEFESITLSREYFQFALDNIDEQNHVDFFNNYLSGIIQTFLANVKAPVTFDNIIKHFLQNVGVKAGAQKTVSHFVDHDGRDCILLTHVYDIKWSRITCNSLVKQIENLLNCHCECKSMPKSVIIKIMEKHVR